MYLQNYDVPSKRTTLSIHAVYLNFSLDISVSLLRIKEMDIQESRPSRLHDITAQNKISCLVKMQNSLYSLIGIFRKLETKNFRHK